MAQEITCFVAVTAIGLMAGIMLGVALAQQTAQLLSAECWTARQNCSDRLFRKIMPPTFILILLASLSAIVVLHHAAKLWMGISFFASLLVIVITMALEVPLNNKFARWEPGKIPDNWQLLRDAWLRNHWLRTYFGIAAFLFSLAACLIHKP
jgi:ethanolamine transporter EutH